MALYTHQDATLDDFDGQGYAFMLPHSVNDQYKGVFFSEEEHADELESLLEDSQVEFSGVAYRKTRAGDVKSKPKTFLVDVQKVVTVSAGVRADFQVLGEVENGS